MIKLLMVCVANFTIEIGRIIDRQYPYLALTQKSDHVRCDRGTSFRFDLAKTNGSSEEHKRDRAIIDATLYLRGCLDWIL